MLTPDNDPFNCGTEGHWQWARWFAALWDQHGGTTDVPIHLRRFHYRLFTLAVDRPDGRAYLDDPTDSYKRLMLASRWARYIGLVDPESIDDRRNDPPIVNVYEHDAGETVIECAGAFWPDELRSVTVPWLHVPRPTVPQLPAPLLGTPYSPSVWLPPVPGVHLPRATCTGGYDGRGPAIQPVILELWIEKSTMDDVLKPLCQGLGLNLVRGSGFLSITRVCELLRRAQALGKDLHVFYVSDHDGAGRKMPCQVARQIEFWRPRLDVSQRVTVQPVALTAEQVERYGLPKAPDSDATELDALEAIHPGELARLIRQAVEEWHDDTLQARLREAEERAAADVARQWREASAGLEADAEQIAAEYGDVLARWKTVATEASRRGRELAEQLTEPVDAVNAAVAALWESLHEEIRALLEPLRERFGEVAEAAERLAGEYEPQRDVADQEISVLADRLHEVRAACSALWDATEFDLPDRPEGEIDPDYDALLYDSDRGWITQQNSYRRNAGLAELQVRGGESAQDRVPFAGSPPAPGPDRDALVARLREGQWTLAQIGELLGISTSRVHQMTARHKRRVEASR